MSTAVAAVSAHLDKYQKYFDTVAPFLTQFIDKRAPTPSVKVASAGQKDLPSSRRLLLPLALLKERLG